MGERLGDSGIWRFNVVFLSHRPTEPLGISARRLYGVSTRRIKLATNSSSSARQIGLKIPPVKRIWPSY